MRLQQIDQASEHQGADDHGRHHHLEDRDVQQKGGHLHLNLEMFTLWNWRREPSDGVDDLFFAREPLAHLREPCQPSRAAAPLHPAGPFSAWSFPTFVKRLALPLL